jgi:hypothetical protein
MSCQRLVMDIGRPEQTRFIAGSPTARVLSEELDESFDHSADFRHGLCIHVGVSEKLWHGNYFDSVSDVALG